VWFRQLALRSVRWHHACGGRSWLASEASREGGGNGRSEAPARQAGGASEITNRLGAVALPLGVIVLVVAEIFHPSREDPMDNAAVFREYANSDIWTTVHLGEYFAFLLLLGGLVALYYSVSAKPGVGAGLAPFGLATAVTAAASFTVLQAVDGIALKRAVDAWVSAPAEQQSAAFAAAEAVRWIEIGMNSLSYFLMGLTLFLYGLSIALGTIYPRWAGLIAALSGAALMYNGVVEVAYEGFVPSIIKLLGLLLLAVWAFILAYLMWRNSSCRRLTRLATTSADPAERPASPR
jgi:hypothetical protein